ncbi:hypothetical protein TNIN_10911 [Trichonephila inaurata madagascariensis]|uniref:Uncharacterized protein n=1 Tax=Trichonephila inaurata madagascariensis TaxID=2747483 RepID=A0A8X6XXK5_9ARAC|nr:hypothetical protein TNIN_10911 [Trichonephila inaurata madagascariensis]
MVRAAPIIRGFTRPSVPPPDVITPTLSLSFQENPVCRKSSKPPTERREGNSRKKKENKKRQGGGRLPDFLPCLCAVCGCPGAFFCGASVEKQTSIYSFSRVYISSSRTRGRRDVGEWSHLSTAQATILPLPFAEVL